MLVGIGQAIQLRGFVLAFDCLFLLCLQLYSKIPADLGYRLLVFLQILFH